MAGLLSLVTVDREDEDEQVDSIAAAMLIVVGLTGTALGTLGSGITSTVHIQRSALAERVHVNGRG